MITRRVPTQERAKKRVEAILDAAAAVFFETGYDGATVDAIAQRAESSVGSIYQFFPNKQALFVALAERCGERTRLLFERVLTPALLEKGWEEILSTMVDAFYEWEQSDISAKAIYRNLHLYGMFEAADRALTKELIESTSQLMTMFSDLPPAQRTVVATTVIHTINSFLFHARQEKPRFARKLLEESKSMLISYLRQYVKH